MAPANRLLRDICSAVEYGYTASAGSNIDGPQFLRITDIVPSLIDWQLVPRCQIDDKKLSKFRLHHNDIVIARTGATVGYAKRIKNPPLSVFASYLVRLKIDEAVADPAYVGAIIESADYKEFVLRNAGGAAQPNANAQVLTSYELPLPAIHSQRRIASILSAYDDLIEKNTRRIAILEEMARRIYEEWFVRFRFPGHEKVRMVESELGLVPEGWRRGQISELYEGLYDGPHATPKPSEDGPIFLGIGNLTESGRLELANIRHIAECDFPEWTKRVQPRPGDIVFTYEATLNRYALIPKGFRGCLGRRLALIRTTPETSSTLFLYCTFFSDEWRAVITQNTLSGATVDRIPLTKFPQFPITIPSFEVLQNFDVIVHPFFAQIEILGHKTLTLRATRDLLLPKLISGELNASHLPEPEAIAA